MLRCHEFYWLKEAYEALMISRGHNRGDQWRAGYIIDSIRALYGMSFGDCYEQQKDSLSSYNCNIHLGVCYKALFKN